MPIQGVSDQFHCLIFNLMGVVVEISLNPEKLIIDN